MLDTSQNWQLFGYDVSQLGARWRLAWRDFLWGGDSPVRARLDEVVRLQDGDRQRFLHADREVAESPASCDGVFLPEELVLARRVRVPLAAEAELDSVMRMEVFANSPFPEDDTGFGWRLLQRDEHKLHLQLVIVSLSATMEYLGREYDSHDPRAQEVWAEVGGQAIMLRGFGETHREQRYRARLLRVAGLLAGCAVLLLAMLGLAAAAKYQELRQYQALHDEVRREAAGAVRLRNSLGNANRTIDAVDQLLRGHPSPHEEIARLTALLSDDTYVSQFTMSARQITLRGRARDAAAVMQLFTNNPAYDQVIAPDPFRAYYNTGLEEFHFRITLAEAAGL